MILFHIYLGRSGDTVEISNLQFETKSGKNYWGTNYKWNLIQDSLKVVSHCESLIEYPNSLSCLS